MTDPLLTLVARAIEQQFAADPICGGRFCAGTAEAAAQAALSVIREQEGVITDAMIEAAREVADGVDDSAFRRIYVAMRAARPLPAPPLEKM